MRSKGFFPKLTEPEKARMKTRFEEYMELHTAACARGEHAWTTDKWGTRYCKYCLEKRP